MFITLRLVNLRNIRPRRAPGQHRPERRRLPSPLAIEEAAGTPAPKDPIPQGCENGRMIIFDSGSGPKNRPFLITGSALWPFKP
jgi:hypothetical protein